MHAYIKTDQQLHVLAQIIAKANRTFVPQKEDDSHTNLCFDPVGNKIAGRWIETKAGHILLSLNLTNFHFEWINDAQNVLQSFSSSGKTADTVESEIEARLMEVALDPAGFTAPLHYDMPDYGFNNTPFESVDPDALLQWTAWRELANQTCEAFLGYVQVPSEIRVWPHHFDTGLYTPVNPQAGLGYGLAMADRMVGGPYFYMAGYVSDQEIDYTRAPQLDLGTWKTEDWKGAVLPLADLASMKQKDVVDALKAFMVKTTEWYLRQ